MTIMESLPRYATDEVLDGETVCTTPEESDAHMNAIINANEVRTDIHIAPSPRVDTCFYQAHRSAQSPTANSSRNRFSTGPMPMSNGQRKTGEVPAITRMPHCLAWY